MNSNHPSASQLPNDISMEGMHQQFHQFQQHELGPLLNNQQLQKRSEDLYNQTNESQKQQYYSEVDRLMKYVLGQQNMNQQNKNDILISNAAGQGQPPYQDQSLNQSSMFSDSKFVPLDQNIGSGLSASKADPLLLLNHQNQSQNIQHNNFNQQSFGQPNHPDQQQMNIIQQYEQVMSLMHQEMQKLILQNKELQENHFSQSSQRNEVLGASNQVQYLLREKEDLLESLRQRETVINGLRIDNEQLKDKFMEMQSRGDHIQSQPFEQSQRLKVDYLSERVQKLESQARAAEQQNFELEQMNKNIKRDVKHQSMINEQLVAEMQEVNQKRDSFCLVIQDLKDRLCQTQLQNRQLNSSIDTQQIQITNFGNLKQQQDKELEHYAFEIERLKEQLNETEGQKLGQFQLLQRKDREIQHLRSHLRRFVSLLQTHRQEFGDIAEVNYDQLLRETADVNISFQLPQSTFHHLPKVHMDRTVQFQPDIGEPIKNKRFGGEQPRVDDDYYGMVDQLTHYIRAQGGSDTYSSPPKRSQIYEYSSNDKRERSQRSILKNSSDRSLQQQPYPDSTGWMAVGAVESQQPQRAYQQPSQKTRSTERKPNLEGLKMTLSALQEEKNNLEQQLKLATSAAKREDIEFELDVASKNIKHIQDKINSAVI